MNILMLNYEFPPIGGGASPVSYDIGKGLVARGNEVTVITMAYDQLPRYEEKDGIKIHRVSCLRKERMVCHPWEQLTYIISAIHFIRKNVEIKSFDICYVHFIIPTGVIAFWLKKKYDLSYIITAHGSDVIGHNTKRFGFLYKLIRKPWCSIVRQADCVVAPSKYLKELMYSNEQNARYKIIRNGVDCNIFQRSEIKKKKILVMCRLQETKNVDCIIKAVKEILHFDWKVDILGDGPCMDKWKTLVEEYGLSDKIHFCGWINNKSEEHLKYLREAAIYISASRVENCPTSILEAMACGDRILISDIPAHRQLVGEIDTTVFFDKDSPSDLAQKIDKIIRECEQTGIYHNSYSMEEYNLDHTIGEYRLLFNESLRNKKI